MFQVHEKGTDTRVGMATSFLLIAQQMATNHLNETGNHCYITQTQLVWATTQLADLSIEGSAV